jgi:MoaA/NifB/PqqE/SkfB family radical SAM enzyme
LNIDGVILSGGEPLIRKDFFQIIDLVYKAGFSVDICTNATLISEDVAKRLREYVSEISVSLDATQSDLHDQLRGQVGAWDLALKGIYYLQNENIDVHTTTILNQKTFNNFDQTMRFLINNNIKSMAIIGEIPFKNNKYFILNNSVQVEIKRKINKLRNEFPEIEINTKEVFSDIGYTYCDAGKYLFSIDAANNFSPCFLFKDYCSINLTACDDSDLLKVVEQYRSVVKDIMEKVCCYEGICPGSKARNLII